MHSLSIPWRVSVAQFADSLLFTKIVDDRYRELRRDREPRCSQWRVFRRSWMRNVALEFFLLFSFFPSQWIATTTRKALFIVQRSQRITRLKSVRPKNERPSTLPFESWDSGTCWYNFLENHCLTAFMSSNIILFVIT